MNPFYKRRWFKVITGLFILCLLFISFLPFAIRYGIEQWYLKQDIDSVSLEDVDLNLFTGDLQLKKLRVIKNKSEVLNLSNAIVSIDWLPLFKKRTYFPHLQIDDLTTGINQHSNGHITIGGVLLPHGTEETATTSSTPWGFGLRAITINNAMLHIKTPTQNADFNIRHITLDRIESWSADESNLDFSGNINNAVVTSSGKFRPFADQPVFEGKIRVENLDISPVAIHLKDHLQELKGLLNLQTEYTVNLDSGMNTHIQTQSRVELNNLLAKLAKNEISLEKLKWQGKANLRLSRDQSLLDYLIEGKIDSENVGLTIDSKLNYHHDKFNWSGAIKSADKDIKRPLINGSIDAQSITVQHLVSQQELFHTDSLIIQQLQASATQQVSSQKITLGDMRTLFKRAPSKEKQTPALLQAAMLSIDSLSITEGAHIKLGNTRLDDALIYIHRQKDGQLEPIATLKSGQAPEEKIADKDENASKTEQQKIQFSVTQFDISGKSRISIVDESVTPSYKTELLITRANIRDIDSGKPNSASPFIVDASLDKYSTLHVDGEAYPFSSPLSLKLNGKFVNINLPPVSSYTADVIGYDLRSGQLNAELSANITKGKIESTNDLTLSNLEVKPSDPKKSENLTSQLSMPLDSALSLLRDKKNNIQLTLPVSGDINNPDFDISGVINKAIGTAMKKASLAYLTQALQPYGSLITLAKLAKAAADHVSLNPITFAPASSQPDNTAREYSEKIAALMNERPQLSIKLCGKAVPLDSEQLIQQHLDTLKSKQAQRPPPETKENINNKAAPPVVSITDEQLLELALKRSDTIKSILVKDHKIDSARLFLCQPTIDPDKDSAPRIDLII